MTGICLDQETVLCVSFCSCYFILFFSSLSVSVLALDWDGNRDVVLSTMDLSARERVCFLVLLSTGSETHLDGMQV